jgi:hypothetical protein
MVTAYDEALLVRSQGLSDEDDTDSGDGVDIPEEAEGVDDEDAEEEDGEDNIEQ